MYIIAIGRIINSSGFSIGYRLLDVETGKCMDASESSILYTILSGSARIYNIGVDGNELYGTMGNLSNLPAIINGVKVVPNPEITIVYRLENEGYIVADYSGKLYPLSNLEAYYYDKHFGTSNAKRLNNGKGKYLGAIGVNFPIMPMTETIRQEFEARLNIVNQKNSKLKMLGEQYRITPDYSIELLSTDITEINIVGPVNKLPHKIFNKCPRLEKIKLPYSIKVIDRDLFAGLRNLRHVELEEGIEAIGSKAFIGCSNLISIKLPSTLKAIGDEAFSGSYNLREIVLPDNLISIGKSAFYCTAIQKIKIPNNVKKINESSFEYCRYLREVRLPQGLEEIGTKAFRSCTNLNIINIPKNLKSASNTSFSCCSKEIKSLVPKNKIVRDIDINIDMTQIY